MLTKLFPFPNLNFSLSSFSFSYPSAFSVTLFPQTERNHIEVRIATYCDLLYPHTHCSDQDLNPRFHSLNNNPSIHCFY